MKKLMIAATAGALVVASQAATINWTSSDAPTGVQLASLNGNGSVAANGAALSGVGTFNYVMSIYNSEMTTLLGSAQGTMSYDMMFDTIENFGIDPGVTFEAGTTYGYKAVISGTQTDMASYTTAAWDYKNATLSAELTGTFAGKMGNISLSTGVPASWTVSGAEAVPEPFSGALALVGLGVIGLRRKLKGKKQEKKA